MSINFPDYPSIGQTYTLGATWRWDGSTWSVVSRSAGDGSSSDVETFVASAAPTDVSEGAFWFDTVNKSLSVYYNSAWEAVGGEGAPVALIQESVPVGTAAGEVWFQPSSETVFVYSGTTWSAANNGVSVTASQTAPSPASEGDLWFDSVTADLFLYFEPQGQSGQWLQVGGNVLASVTTQETTPLSASEGDLWFQSSSGSLFVRYTGAWIEVAGEALPLIRDIDGDTLIQVEEGPDEDVIRFDTAGSERMTIDAGGAVAIVGTASIGGSASLSGGVTIGSGGTEFTLPTVDGTENQVLKTNGSGAVSWVDRDLVTVNHGSTATTARPTGVDKVLWIGTADPTNKATGDIWLDLT